MDNNNNNSNCNNKRKRRAWALLGTGALLVLCAGVGARPSCNGLSNGYYCTSNATAHYYWCYGQEYPVEGECASPLVCTCGFTAQNPCVWAGTRPSDCEGNPGDYLVKGDGDDDGDDDDDDEPTTSDNTGDDDDVPDEEYINGIYAMPAKKHVPLALYFDTANWRKQLKEVMAAPFFDDATQYTASPSDYMCSFHPPSKYDKNPSQLWIGRPSGTMTISYTPGITMRLPDKYIGLYLGYAMDQYGLNPSMLLALAAKESFLPVIWASDDKSYFIVDNEDEHYNCYSTNKNGLCTDGNLDGPFQVETGGMSSDVASFPHRFYTGDTSVPKADRVPSYLTDNEFLQQSGFRAFHDSYTLHMGKAVVLTALDFHFRHNLLWTMRKSGLYSAMTKRTDRSEQDSLEFAVMMYTYNRGVFDTQIVTMLHKCEPGMNPTECGLDGYGGHTTDIRTACKLLDQVPNSEVYDWTVTAADMTHFIDVLAETYPYDTIPGIQDHIAWDKIHSEAQEAFDMLKAHRALKSGSQYRDGISFRYDWRALLAVIRMRLPPREAMLGPSVQNFANYWGTTRSPKLEPTVAPSTFPLTQCCLAGGREDVCSGAPPVSEDPDEPVVPPVEESSSSSESKPGELDRCPNDPDKTDPGVCGCGVPETTWCCSKAAYAECDAEVPENHKTNNECNTLMKWGRCLVNKGCSNAQLMMNALARCRPCRAW